MKKLLPLLLFVGSFTFLFGQNTVLLNINHELDGAPFSLNAPAQNDFGHDFKVTRLEYYISNFTIVHDGGIETNINSVYTLVDASEATSIDLGSHNINSVEAIKFYVGVDSIANHSDPASYPMTHALAPKLPSMHWGWASGYRFVALEGTSGVNYNQTIELHGLGDENYYETEVLTTATASNNQVTIDVYANYGLVLDRISINGGAFNHGFAGEIITLFNNFQDKVFQSFPTSINEVEAIKAFEVFPNPTTGKITLSLETEKEEDYQIQVTNLLGQEVLFLEKVNTTQSIDLSDKESGLYFIQLVKNGKTLKTEKLLVK